MARCLAALNEAFHPVSIVNIQIPELKSRQKPIIRKFAVDKEGSLLNWLRVLTRYFKANNRIMLQTTLTSIKLLLIFSEDEMIYVKFIVLFPAKK